MNLISENYSGGFDPQFIKPLNFSNSKADFTMGTSDPESLKIETNDGGIKPPLKTQRNQVTKSDFVIEDNTEKIKPII